MNDRTHARQGHASAEGPAAAPETPATVSFEDALKTLEETVEELRSEGLGLARALDLYEQGTRLAAYCEELLTTAELRLSRVEATGGATSASEVLAARRVAVEEEQLEADW